MVRAAQKGEMVSPSPQIQRVASSIKKKDAKDFASTKHKGLPMKKFSEMRTHLGEEEYDHYRDKQLERGTWRGGSSSNNSKPSGKQPKGKTVLQKQADKKYGAGTSAMDRVKADIMAKYGKGAIMKTKKEEVDLDEAKVDKGRSDYGKASIRNYRRSGPGHDDPGMFDPSGKRGKTIDKRREEHKARRGVKGAKVPAYKREEVENLDEVTAKERATRDAGAIAKKKMRNKEHKKFVNFLDVDESKIVEAKVDLKTPEHKRATVRDKRYGNPHGSLELGGGIRKDRRADHEAKRGVKKEAALDEVVKMTRAEYKKIHKDFKSDDPKKPRTTKYNDKTGGTESHPVQFTDSYNYKRIIARAMEMRAEREGQTLNERGDYWHPDPEKDKKLGGPGANARAREDRADAAKPKEDSKKLRKGESYMDYAKRTGGYKSSYKKSGRTPTERLNKMGANIKKKEGLRDKIKRKLGLNREQVEGKSFAQFLEEGNRTGRMMQKSKTQVTGHISADRGSDEKKNREGRKGLEKDLKKHGIGHKKGVGEYKYDSGETGREVSYQTSKPDKMSKRRFGKVMRRMGRKHGQESVITKDKDKSAKLHYTEKGSKQKSDSLGKTKAGKHPQGYGETSGTKARGGKLPKKTNKSSYHYG